MTQLSIGTWAFGVYAEHPLPFAQVLDRIAELKFDGVELGAFDPHPSPLTHATKAERKALAGAFASRNLQISAVATDFGERGFIGGDADEYLNALDRNLVFCQEVGASRLIVNTMASPEEAFAIGEAKAMENLLATWKTAAARAKRAAVTLAFEFEPCWALNAPEQVIRIAHALAGPGFGVLYDTAHSHIVSEVGRPAPNPTPPLRGGQEEMLRRLAGTIVHVHMLDSDGSIHQSEKSTERTTVHVPFGQGNVDFARVVPALIRAGGAGGWWTVDLCFWPDAWGAAEACKQFVDRLARTYLDTAPASES